MFQQSHLPLFSSVQNLDININRMNYLSCLYHTNILCTFDYASQPQTLFLLPPSMKTYQLFFQIQLKYNSFHPLHSSYLHYSLPLLPPPSISSFIPHFSIFVAVFTTLAIDLKISHSPYLQLGYSLRKIYPIRLYE